MISRLTWSRRKSGLELFSRTKSARATFSSKGSWRFSRSRMSAGESPRRTKRSNWISGSHATQTVRSTLFSRFFSNSNGISTTQRDWSEARMRPVQISCTRGCRMLSSRCNAAGSEKTRRPRSGRSTPPAGDRTSGPKAAATSAATSASSASKSRTIASQSRVAKPASRKNPAAVDLPHPMPPVRPRTRLPGKVSTPGFNAAGAGDGNGFPSSGPGGPSG